MLNRPTDTPESFAIRLLRLKSRECLGDSELARVSGVSLGAIRDYAAGRKDNPTMMTLIKLARTFGVSTDYLCGLKDKP